VRFFPVGYDARPGVAPGYIDEVLILDGAAEVSDVCDGKVPRGCSLIVRGWAFDADRHEPAAHLLLRVGERPGLEALYGTPRPDVARVFDDAAREQTGFMGVLSTGSLALGPHEVNLLVVDRDNGYQRCGSTFAFDLVASSAQIPVLSEAPAETIEASFSALPRVAASGEAIVVRGSAFDRAHGAPCRALFLKVGAECVRAAYGTPDCRFTARFDTRLLRPGTYGVELVAIASDGSSVAHVGSSTSLEIVANDEQERR
jgi:hypothetical protein